MKRQDGELIETSVESEFSQFRPLKTWVPSRCEFYSHHDGKLFAHQVTRVSDVALNEPLTPNTFSLTGLGLPPDTVVVNHAPTGARVLTVDGDKVAPLESSPSTVELPQKVADEEAPGRKVLDYGTKRLYSAISHDFSLSRARDLPVTRHCH